MKNFTRLYSLPLLLICMLAAVEGRGQTSYLGLDGGFEGSATIDNTNVYAAAQAGKWAKANATQTITNETTTVRSGANALKINNTSASGRRVWSPLISFSSVTTQVTIQYYRYVSNATNSQANQEGTIRSATENLQGTYDTPTAGTWEKQSYTPTTSIAYTSIAGIIMHRIAGTGGDMFIDDMAVYTGTADNTAPNSAGAVTVNNPTTASLDISWGAASGGVDGGGYMVVRYAASPNADNDPLANGIYAAGNTYTHGTGSLTGTVRYVGTGTSFTDNAGLNANTQYWYKVYTFDKAYNYAAESSGNGTTSSGGSPSITITPGSFNGAFGNQCISTNSSPSTYSVSGSNLTNNIDITPPSSFQIKLATDPVTSFSGNVLTLTQSGGAVASTDIDVRFSPTATGATGPVNITHASSGASTQNVSVSGTGVNTTPTVTTGSGSASTTSDASAAGTISANGCSSVTAYGIEYSTTNGFANGTGTQQSSGNLTGGNYSSSLSSLSANTTYYFKAYATNGGGTAYGSQASFITYPDAPTGLSANNVTASGFTVNWTEVSGGTTEVYDVQVFSDAGYSTQVGSTLTTAANATSQGITGLSSSTPYWYRVRAKNNSGTQTSTWVNGPASVTTLTGPCLSQDFASNTLPSGWTQTSITFTSNYAEFGANTGELTTVAVANPTSLDFNVSRTTNTTAKTLYVEVSTTSQSSGFAIAGTYDHSNTTSGGITAINVDLSAYSANGTVYIRFRKASSTTSPWRLDDIAVYCGPPIADINVKGNSISIADADVTPSTTDHTQFADTEAGLTATRTFTIENAGSAGTINISSVSVSGTGFTISDNIDDNALTTGESTTFEITFSPNSIASFSGTVTIANDDPDAGEQSYTFALAGNGTVSQQSVVTAVASSEANTISSLNNIATIANNTQGAQVWQFRLYDGNGSANDGDGLPTVYTGFTLNMGSGNMVTNWANAMQDVRFFEGSTLIAGTVTIGGVNIIFTPTTPISVSDGAASYKEISMRLSLKNPLPASSDGLKFVFQLQKSNVSVQSSATSSQLSNFSNLISDNTKNVIDVSGTVLQFVSPPTVVNVNNVFSITVAAYDANGNADLSNTGTVTLSKTVGTGTFSVSNATTALAGGTYTWTDAMHNTEETITLQAAGAGFSSITTNILVQSAPYIMFDNFNRGTGSFTSVGSPSSGGTGTWTEDESGTSCSPANAIIRVSSNALELSNCNEGNTLSCGTSNNKQISFNMTGRYPTIYDNSPEVLEWYVNLSHTRSASSLSGFGSGNYGLAFILGSTEQDFNSTTAQGYALIAGETGTPDPLRLVSFNGQPSNWTSVINSTVDFVGDMMLSARVTYDPSSDIWSLQVRDDGSSFTDPTNMTGYPAALTSSANTTYTNKNLKYYGAFWNHGASCEEFVTIDNAYIPSVPTVPEIQVTAGPTTGTLNINDGDTYDFGPVNVSSGSVTQTFTITNTGLAALLLQGSPNKVVKSGTHSADFTVTQPAAASLAPGASTTFTVTFDPSASGLRTATLTIDNNDGDEDPFVFNLNGTGGVVPVVNEFVVAHIGTDDREFIEVFGDVATNYSNMTLLVLEGDATNKGVIDNVISVGTTDAAGYWWTGYLNSQIENGTITFLLVMNFSGSLSQDLDTDNNGILDITPWTRILDDVSLRVTGSDVVYSTTIIVPNFDGTFLTPGGASRIANGIDTDNISNWMRNDADGWGLAGYSGTANANEAKNTPKRVNTRFNVWLGTTTVWTNAANWTVRVPNDTTEAVIPTIGSSTYPNITGIVTYDCNGLYFSSTASTITIGAGAEIRNYGNFESFSNSTTFGAGTISFTGNFENNISGTFTIGELLINNPNSVTVASLTVINITDALTLQAGLLSNSGTINLKSSATKTAYVDDFSGSNSGLFNGNLTLERYVPSVASGNIFHYIGAVSSAQAGGKWGDDFGMGVSGTNGYVTPLDCNPASPSLAQGSNYGGFFTYNESNVSDCYLTGWKVENTNYNLTPGKGIAARINNGVVLDETGTYPNPVTNVTVSNLTKTTANTVAYSRGYNLVANPFYAPLDMTGLITDLVADSDWDGSVYIYDPSSGSYSAYNFLSSNPSTINTNQGFFIRAGNATAQSTTLDFVFNESRRVAASNTTFYRQPQQYAYGLNIMVETSGKTDATIIAFHEAFTNAFDNGYDAMKLYNDVGIPSLYSKSGDDQQAIHALPLLSDSTRSIPLSILITTSGTHTFTFSGMEDFPSTSLIWLEDVQTGMFHDLRLNPTYVFTANVNDNNDRFMLHFTAPILTNAVAATCSGNDGEISLQLPAGVEWSFVVKNESDAIVARHTGNGGSSVINALPQGNYTITFIYDGNYSVTETVTVVGLQEVVADFAPVNNVFEGEEIQFTNNSSGATIYEWDFGDGTTASGIAEPTHTYLSQGTYTVTLRAANDDCAAVFTQQVVVSKQPTVGVDKPGENKLTVFAHEGALYVQFDFLKPEVAEISVTNVLGQEIFKADVYSEGMHIFNFREIESSQYLLVSVRTAALFEVRKIFLP